MPVRSLFSELHLKFTAERPHIDKGELLRCLYFTCVHPSARRQGVMQGLWRHTIDVARENGFSSICAQASSESVRSILEEDLGFQQLAAVAYKDFEMPAAEAQSCGHSGRVFAELADKDPKNFQSLSMLYRRVPSNLYV
jgi:hypothetical protein